VTHSRRFSVLPRLGIAPSTGELVRAALDRAMDAAEADGEPIAVLDAGCGRASALRPYRDRIARFVGADIHRPAAGSLPYLDEFATVDLCADREAFPSSTFHLILSSFTVEHFADPAAAFRHFRSWLRPGGRLVITTVNRRHPFVRAYLSTPEGIRRQLQRLVKASEADAHPLVGACNDPTAIGAALRDVGFADVRIQMTGHLARAWGRRWPTYALGLAGDLLSRGLPSRRSTIVAEAVAPAEATAR
jgi:SAM-dependent methyltransferase